VVRDAVARQTAAEVARWSVRLHASASSTPVAKGAAAGAQDRVPEGRRGGSGRAWHGNGGAGCKDPRSWHGLLLGLGTRLGCLSLCCLSLQGRRFLGASRREGIQGEGEGEGGGPGRLPAVLVLGAMGLLGLTFGTGSRRLGRDGL
jgi:hypothetical protein